MTILELAFRRLRDYSVPDPMAQDILAHFATAGGRDIDWEGIAPQLSKPQAQRIDVAANGWLLAHGACVKPAEPKRAGVRDGKMLAAGDE